MTAKGADFIHEVIAAAKTALEWRKSLPKNYLRPVRSAGYKTELKHIEAMHKAFNAKPTADIVLNQRYLDKFTLPLAGSVLLVDSPMGTGKTSKVLAGIVEEHRSLHPGAVGVISAYRNILLKQVCEEFDFTHWLDTDGDPSFGKFDYLAACPESLPKLSGQSIPNGSIFLLDEIVAEMRHVYCSDTMKNGADRIIVRNALKTLLKKILEGGGYVIGLEANIPQWAIDCLRELLPDGTPIKLVRNEFKMQANEKAFFYDKLIPFKAELESIKAKCVRPIIASDSATQIDLQLRVMFDGPRDFFISAKNSSDEDAQEFAQGPKEFLAKRNGVSSLGFSPTIGAGIDIKDDEDRKPWFDVKAGIFTHLTSGEAAQQMTRYRRPVPVHVFCNSAGLGIGDSDLSIFTPEGLRARWREDDEYFCDLAKISKYLSQFNGESLEVTLRRSMDGDIPDIAQIDKWRSTITAVDNFDKLHLRDNLKAKFAADGYEVVDVITETIPGKAAEYASYREEAEFNSGKEFAALTVPEDLTTDEARTILSSHGHTRQQTLQARKCLYQFEFPGCDFDSADFCTEWLIKNKGKKLNQLRDEWAARNPEQAKAIDRWHLKGKLKQAHNLATGVSMADVSRKSPAADVFAKAKLPEAIDAIGTEVYGNEHPEVVRIAGWVDSNKPILKKVFRMKFNEDRTNLDIFNAFARKLGYSPKKEKQAGKTGSREKQYILSDFCNPDRGHMLKSLSDKFTAKLEQKGEELGGKRLSGTPDWGVSSQELAERQAAAKPIALPVKAVALPEPTITENKAWDWQIFEADLIDAQSMAELATAKARTPESLRTQVMTAWQADGRYDWLKAKAEKLAAA